MRRCHWPLGGTSVAHVAVECQRDPAGYEHRAERSVDADAHARLRFLSAQDGRATNPTSHCRARVAQIWRTRSERFGAEEPSLLPVARFSRIRLTTTRWAPFASGTPSVAGGNSEDEPLDDDLLPVPTSQVFRARDQPERWTTRSEKKPPSRSSSPDAQLIAFSRRRCGCPRLVGKGGNDDGSSRSIAESSPDVRPSAGFTVNRRTWRYRHADLLTSRRAPGPLSAIARATRNTIPDRPAPQPATIVAARPQPVAARPSVAIISASPRVGYAPSGTFELITPRRAQATPFARPAGPVNGNRPGGAVAAPTRRRICPSVPS